ncbi:hypothetical protein ScPMuIL_012619 [Solemya velum]
MVTLPEILLFSMAEEREKVIEAEISQVKERAPSIEGVKLITCVPMFVIVSLKKTEQKHLTANLQFPPNYPNEQIVVELKSKTLSDKLLYGLTNVCDQETKKWVGQKQVMVMINFIMNFMEENPLCICSDEISDIKKKMLSDCDDLKLKQKSSQLVFRICQNNYHMSFVLSVPEFYPSVQIGIEVGDYNFPELLKTHFQANAVEIARKCVQPPLKKNSKEPPFKPAPSLKPVCEFLINDCIKKYPQEVCPVCTDRCLPTSPGEKLSGGRQVERVYCGHIFHHGCLRKYMKTPPFTGGKKCPSCGKQIFHQKWRITPELAEARWAHKQARQRELEEVVDFLD